VGKGEGRAGGKEKESNWLSAPAGGFIPMRRLYWAEETIIGGSWKPPAVTLAK
jgi:hypothetical protein